MDVNQLLNTDDGPGKRKRTEPFGAGNYSGSLTNGEFRLHDDDRFNIKSLRSRSSFHKTQDCGREGGDDNRDKNEEDAGDAEKDDNGDEGKLTEVTDHIASINLRSNRRKYTEGQMSKFFSIYFDQVKKNVGKASREAKVDDSTARDWVRKYNSTGAIPYPKEQPKIWNSKMTIFVSRFIAEANEKGTVIQSQDILNALTVEFKTELSLTTLKTNLKRLGFSYKSVQENAIQRNTLEKINLRKEWISRLQESGADYTRNCIFFDEAAFDANMIPRKGWEVCGKPLIVETKLTREISYSVLGAMCYHGIVDLSVKVPKSSKFLNSELKTLSLPGNDEEELVQVQAYKRRKISKESHESSTLPEIEYLGHKQLNPKSKGTSRDHFMLILWRLMYRMKENEDYRNGFVVLDNAAIHKGSEIEDLVSHMNYTHGTKYKLLYLPPYSPQLNPIENFWSKLKHEFRSTTEKGFIKRLSVACNSVSDESLKKYVTHSTLHFSQCLNKEPLVNIKTKKNGTTKRR